MKTEKVKTKSKKDKALTNKELTSKVKSLEAIIKSYDLVTEDLKRNINRVEAKLKTFMNQHTSQIRVLEKNGKWGGYTGVFHLNTKNNKKRVIEKAMHHYNSYFKNVDFYKNRTLGLFITNNKEVELVKVLQDNQNKLEKNGINNNN